MENPSRIALYNLSAVLRETGLKADLVRAWERRYNLPKPQRSSGGHRLYSAFDIELLKWLKGKQAEGLSISSAVELWRSLNAEGQDPLTSSHSSQPGLPAEVEDISNSIEALRQHWLEACMQFNSSVAEEVLNRAFTLYPVETVCVGVLQKGLNEIGAGWYADRISVQQEHFASALANRRLDTLMSLAPLPSRQQTILLGCPAGEWHTFPVLLLDLFLRRRGWKVVNLGADIPVDRVVTTTLSINPDLVIMAAQTIVSAAALREGFLALRASAKPLAYGGLIFNRIPALRERIPGYFLGEGIEESITAIETMLRNPLVKSQSVTEGSPYLELIQLFQEKRMAMELQLLERSAKDNLPFEFLNEANNYFGNGLIAALKLGDPAYIRADLEWIGNMLTVRQIPSSMLFPYLRVYREVLEANLGKNGSQILAIIDAYITDNTINQ